jgi:glycosyltransferase involved in cell wall biosynthesis
MMLTLHDIIYLESVNFKGTAYQNFGNLYRRWVVPQVVKKSEIVITVSSFERENIIKTMGLPPEKVTVVYNAVHPRFRKIDDAVALTALKTQFQLPDQFILFLGNTAPKKNTPGTIAAYIDYARSVHQPVPMVILDYAAPLVEQQLKDLNASDMRHLLIIPGYIPSAKMPELYNLATIFLYPSFRESFGLPLLEAMACGTPVITSNTSCMPEIAGGACLLMDPFDKLSMTEAIATLLSEPDRMKMLSELGAARASAFSWTNAAKQVLDIYEKFPRLKR